jgi:hypothetical protein
MLVTRDTADVAAPDSAAAVIPSARQRHNRPGTLAARLCSAAGSLLASLTGAVFMGATHMELNPPDAAITREYERRLVTARQRLRRLPRIIDLELDHAAVGDGPAIWVLICPKLEREAERVIEQELEGVQHHYVRANIPRAQSDRGRLRTHIESMIEQKCPELLLSDAVLSGSLGDRLAVKSLVRRGVPEEEVRSRTDELRRLRTEVEKYLRVQQTRKWRLAAIDGVAGADVTIDSAGRPVINVETLKGWDDSKAVEVRHLFEGFRIEIVRTDVDAVIYWW